MRWLAQVFASAFVRKVAFVVAGALVYAILSFVGIRDAHAAIVTAWNCSGGSCRDVHDTATDAAAHAESQALAHTQSFCSSLGQTASVHWVYQNSWVDPVGAGFQEKGQCVDSIPPPVSGGTYHASSLHYHNFQTNNCGDLPDHEDWLYPPTQGGSNVCDGGCQFQGGVDLITGRSVYSPTGAICGTNGTEPSTAPDTDNDGVPDQDDDFPNDPTETTDTDGDGVGDGSDTDPDDPTNGSDDGTGDNEDDNQASGGATCGQPPQCTGDAIACNTNWQIWKMRCSTTAVVTGSPEVCNTAYSCTGDSAQCAKINLLRKAACDAVTTAPGGTPVGDTNLNGIPDALEGDGSGYTPGSVEGAVTTHDGTAQWDGLASGGWLGAGSGSCPGLPALVIGGNTYQLDGFACEHGQLLHSFMVMLGFVFAAAIIGRAAAGS